jgi:hypothetical protein
LENPIQLKGDLKIELYSRPKIPLTKKKSKLCQAWINTQFAEEICDLESDEECKRIRLVVSYKL